MNKEQQIIKAKAIKDFDIIKGIASFKKDEEYEFTYDENFDKYMVEVGVLENGVTTLGLPKSDIDKHFYTEKETPLNKPTFGEKLVGKSFNPSKDSKVDKLKSLFAEITDIVNEHSEEMPTDILNKDFGMIQSSIYLGCLTDILKAQMLSVKFVTLQKD